KCSGQGSELPRRLDEVHYEPRAEQIEPNLRVAFEVVADDRAEEGDSKAYDAPFPAPPRSGRRFSTSRSRLTLVRSARRISPRPTHSCPAVHHLSRLGALPHESDC